jgi:protein phosphatase PTC2/3
MYGTKMMLRHHHHNNNNCFSRGAAVFGIYWSILVVLVGASGGDCPSYGCSMLPRDVVFDDAARSALARIRRHGKEVYDNDDDDLLLVGTLAMCGNPAHATLTLIGYKGGREEDQINQDRAFVINPFMGKYHLSGVYDGHGDHGEIVSEYAVRELPKRLATKLQDMNVNDEAAVVQALKDTFVEIDNDAKAVSGGMGGCTASVILQIENRLYVANAGDSISIVATCDHEGTTRVHFVTREDKPHLDDERARIEGMGGRVWIPPDLTQESSRVIFVDPDTGYQSGLAMSRSIGDWDMIGVVAEPLVEVISLKTLLCLDTDNQHETCNPTSEEYVPSNVFVVTATDGMMDYIEPQEIAEAFAAAFVKKEMHPLTVAEDLIHLAAKGWETEMAGQYRDDIAVAASMLTSK